MPRSLIVRVGAALAVLVAIVAGTSALTRTTAGADPKVTPPCKPCEGYATGQPLQTPNAVSSVNGMMAIVKVVDRGAPPLVIPETAP